MVGFTLSREIKELRKKAKTFMEEYVYPKRDRLPRGRPQADSLMKELQARMKAMGMRAMFIGPEAACAVLLGEGAQVQVVEL
jgi:alkylation response protein AidB-like acyl-CoA dehydrogenase